MSNYHSAYSLENEKYLPNYANREDGRKLVRELIRDLVSDRIDGVESPEQLKHQLADWAAAHPIALLETEFRIEIRQHDEPIEIKGA